MAAERTLYEILQVDPGVEPEILEAAYRRLARKYHPDVSADGAGDRRMKEINAAYDVLRDPLRRAAYDRRRRDVAAADGPDDERESYRPADPRLGCRLHPDAVAVATCGDCGAGLCGCCLGRFQPPSCAACILAWTTLRRRQLWLPAFWFIGAMGVLTYLLLHSVNAVLLDGRAWTTVAYAFGYLVASYPTGWRVVHRPGADLHGEGLLLALALALVVGPIVAPFRMGKIAWDLHRLGRLEALARSV